MVDSNETIAERICYRTGLGRKAGDGSFLSEINKLINSGRRYDSPTVTAHQRKGKSEGESGSVALLLAGIKNPMGLWAHRVFLRRLPAGDYLVWRTGMAFGTAAACAWRLWTVGAGFWNWRTSRSRSLNS